MDKEARNNLTPLKLRAKAAKFAKDTVKTQMSSFKVPSLFALYEFHVLLHSYLNHYRSLTIYNSILIAGKLFQPYT